MLMKFEEARDVVERQVRNARTTPEIEEVRLDEAPGRVLAETIVADRPYPPFDRATRDGYAVRAADVPGTLRVCGQVRAGQQLDRTVGRGEAIEIMTGAPVPAGADAVVMVEHTRREGDQVEIGHHPKPGDDIVPRGSEACAAQPILGPGQLLGYPEIAVLASFGRMSLQVYRRPRVAIISTGDEVVELDRTPLPYQIRNSNAHSLMSQVARAGAVPVRLPIAPDERARTRELIERGLKEDLLLLSGGVSAGRYDLVEEVLAELGAEFFFDGVLIQPGKPLVFGRARGKFFFGLPGNPLSTMVTFEVFARAAVDLLAGVPETPLRFLQAPLGADFRHKPGLTRFLPAVLAGSGAATVVNPVKWQGSGDVVALTRSNAFLVAAADRETWKAGDLIPVLPR